MNRSEYNRSQTISAIQDCFIKKYEEIGLEKITVRAICEECSVSRTIFYKYFDDKYDVLDSIERELLDGLAEIHRRLLQTSSATCQRNAPFQPFFESAEYIRENEIYFRALLGIHGDPQFIYRWKQQVRKDVKKEFEHNHVSAVHPDLVTELIASEVIGVYTYWLFEDSALSAQEIAETAANLLGGSFFAIRTV